MLEKAFSHKLLPRIGNPLTIEQKKINVIEEEKMNLIVNF